MAEGVEQRLPKGDLGICPVFEVVRSIPQSLEGIVGHDPVEDPAQGHGNGVGAVGSVGIVRLGGHPGVRPHVVRNVLPDGTRRTRDHHHGARGDAVPDHADGLQEILVAQPEPIPRGALGGGSAPGNLVPHGPAATGRRGHGGNNRKVTRTKRLIVSLVISGSMSLNFRISRRIMSHPRPRPSM